MVEILDTLWWGVIALAFLALFVGDALVRVHNNGPDAAADDPEEYEPEPMTLGDWRNEHEGREVPRGDGWAECFCCGCPAIDAAEDFPECGVCGWDGDVDGVDAARESFARYGSADPADEDTALAPTARALTHEIAAACAAVPEGEAPPPEFWPAFYERLKALDRARAGHRAAG